MTRTRLFPTLAGLTLLTSPAFAIDFEASDNGIIDFDMPSGNICCAYKEDGEEGPELSCTRVKPKYWIVTLKATGDIDVYKNPGEVPGCGYGEPLGNVFEYGTTWKMDGIRCSSATSGISCKANGRGFTLSRKGLNITP